MKFIVGSPFICSVDRTFSVPFVLTFRLLGSMAESEGYPVITKNLTEVPFDGPFLEKEKSVKQLAAAFEGPVSNSSPRVSAVDRYKVNKQSSEGTTVDQLTKKPSASEVPESFQPIRASVPKIEQKEAPKVSKLSQIKKIESADSVKDFEASAPPLVLPETSQKLPPSIPPAGPSSVPIHKSSTPVDLEKAPILPTVQKTESEKVLKYVPPAPVESSIIEILPEPSNVAPPGSGVSAPVVTSRQLGVDQVLANEQPPETVPLLGRSSTVAVQRQSLSCTIPHPQFPFF